MRHFDEGDPVRSVTEQERRRWVHRASCVVGGVSVDVLSGGNFDRNDMRCLVLILVEFVCFVDEDGW